MSTQWTIDHYVKAILACLPDYGYECQIELDFHEREYIVMLTLEGESASARFEVDEILHPSEETARAIMALGRKLVTPFELEAARA